MLPPAPWRISKVASFLVPHRHSSEPHVPDTLPNREHTSNTMSNTLMHTNFLLSSGSRMSCVTHVQHHFGHRFFPLHTCAGFHFHCCSSSFLVSQNTSSWSLSMSWSLYLWRSHRPSFCLFELDGFVYAHSLEREPHQLHSKCAYCAAYSPVRTLRNPEIQISDETCQAATPSDTFETTNLSAIVRRAPNKSSASRSRHPSLGPLAAPLPYCASYTGSLPPWQPGPTMITSPSPHQLGLSVSRPNFHIFLARFWSPLRLVCFAPQSSSSDRPAFLLDSPRAAFPPCEKVGNLSDQRFIELRYLFLPRAPQVPPVATTLSAPESHLHRSCTFHLMQFHGRASVSIPPGHCCLSRLRVASAEIATNRSMTFATYSVWFDACSHLPARTFAYAFMNSWSHTSLDNTNFTTSELSTSNERKRHTRQLTTFLFWRACSQPSRSLPARHFLGTYLQTISWNHSPCARQITLRWPALAWPLHASGPASPDVNACSFRRNWLAQNNHQLTLHLPCLKRSTMFSNRWPTIDQHATLSRTFGSMIATQQTTISHTA